MTARSSNYLPHVDGLRCVAVLSVLLFHFGVPGLAGGYVGVDVFFVISGYLITRIIVDELASTGRLDFGGFYARRIRRIVPALLATLAVTTVLAVASLTPADLVAYGKSLAASAVSMSNLLFWSESGYFDAASKTKPLLHTWSLSVEEQFYLFWPVFLYLAYRLKGRHGLIWGILVAGLLSFAANYWAVATQRIGYLSDLFFLPQYRVFEFAIGAIGCFLLPLLPTRRGLHEVLAASGLLLIGWSIVVMDEGIVFPYTNALVPCLGALLVIAASGARGIGVVLTNPISVWLGKVSYSLYLAHWPVVVFVEQYLPTSPWPVRFAVMVSLSIFSAVTLHRLVETRFRHPGANGRLRVAGTVSASAMLAMLGVFVLTSNGMMWRYQYFTPGALISPGSVSPGVEADAGRSAVPVGVFRPLGADDIEGGKARRFEDVSQACSIDRLDDAARCAMSRPKQVLLFGNSHEPDAFNAFHHLYGHDQRVNLINFGTVNDCRVIIEAGRVSSPTPELGCDRRFSILDGDEFLRKLDVLVYNTHQGFDPVAAQLWEIMADLKVRKPSLRIVAIGSYLQTSSECASLYNRYRTYAACRRDEFVSYFNPDERSRTTVPQVATLEYLYVSKYSLLCGDAGLAGCATSANGEPAFYDQHHLSRGFAWHLGDRIAQVHGADLAEIGLPLVDGAGNPQP